MTNSEFVQRLGDHPGLDVGRRILLALANAPAMAWPVDQNHPVVVRQKIAERLPHRLQVGACAVDHHNGRVSRIVSPQFDHIQDRASDLDRLSPWRVSLLKYNHTGLREQRKHCQCRYNDD